MNDRGTSQIVNGISLSATGEATVSPEVSDLLFDLAIALEEPTKLPVDVQHVLAAIVLAAQSGELKPDDSISADDEKLMAILVPHIKRVFADYGGQVGADD